MEKNGKSRKSFSEREKETIYKKNRRCGGVLINFVFYFLFFYYLLLLFSRPLVITIILRLGIFGIELISDVRLKKM